MQLVISAYHTYVPSEVDNDGVCSFSSPYFILTQRWQWPGIRLKTTVADKFTTMISAGGVWLALRWHKRLEGHKDC
jgi:hypothetical protein